ncbi:MAG: trehalase family glycosidase, partial [Bacteroidota bacterium]
MSKWKIKISLFLTCFVFAILLNTLGITIAQVRKDYYNVEENIKNLLLQEDTDKDNKITVEDEGPKKFNAVTTDGDTIEITGTYYLSNLLQELVLAKESGNAIAEIAKSKIFEKPVDRINRMIKEYYWNGLTRRIDADGIKRILVDTKTESKDYYLYVPFRDKTAYDYYQKIAEEIKEINIHVVKLPEVITPGYVRSINDKPGVLSLALRKNEKNKIEGVPFVVPGGRFNEMYGWDSYF